ncbi:MAG TPA: EAL domain-containing protein [Polyangiaceae bacterium]|jgi:EAL domain-containing protein (putative c-di-GMP-specific phosphodiesterase class I)|nr:EAL domain-containing protein [Polyangiaceae bacterium]
MPDEDPNARHHAGAWTGPGTIVLVDDNPTALSLLERILAGTGKVAAFDRGEDAVRRVKDGGVEVVVTDVTMPGMSGLDLLRQVRACDADLPVILVTGLPSVESAAEAIEHGVFRYLTKPYGADAIRGTVRQAAQLYRLARMKREALALAGSAGASDRTGLEVSFGRALERLSLVFQPVVSVSTRSVFAHEALMRSAEPTLPGPAEVLEAAERLGALFDVGRVVRRWAGQLFHGAGKDALLFLNLHPQELLDPELLDPEGPLAPLSHRVVLEITERSSLQKIHDVRARVALLRAAGFRIAVDDLGAGYAGLTSFAVLEPDVVKLDMSLTRNVGANPLKQRVVESMTSLCREMGMTIIAEGVETAEERDALLELGCDLQQGYLFARPGPPFPKVTWPSIAQRATEISEARQAEVAGLALQGPATEPALDDGPPKVLIVDDEEPLRIILERALAGAGMSVYTAANGNEALRVVAGGTKLNAIVTDLRMPELDGIGFMRAVRETDLDVPMIVLTGHASVESAIAAVEYGGFRYLQKPLEKAGLVAVVKEAAAMHRVALLKRSALEVCDAGRWLIGDEAGLDAHFDRALEKLWIAFQPIVAWSDQSVFGYEALVRSTESVLGTPEQLFEAAERLGRVSDLGRAIRREVAACAPSAPGDTAIFVNLHASELGDEELFSSSAPLSLEARRVVLEVTDRAPLHRVPDLRERAGRLRELGYRLAIDDLGVGYAGLSSLSRLEPEVAKLDIALIRGVDGSARRAGIIRSMISVWQNDLGARVVCEGVETTAERDALGALGADLLQGFLFAPPEPGFRRPSMLAPAGD